MDDTIATPTDSPPQFREIDDLLKCGICYATFTTPVITSCSHTFCSLCIRRWLTAKQVCPSCSDEIYETTLRKNTIVGNILDAVENLKKKILGSNSISSLGKTFTSPKNEDEERRNFQPKMCVQRTPKQNYSPKLKKTPIPVETPPTQRPAIVQKSPKVENERPSAQRSLMVPSTPTPARERAQLVDDDRSPALKVPCPCCHVLMAQGLVFDHLNRCGVTRSSDSTKSSTSKSSEILSPKATYTGKKNIAKSSTSAESNNPPPKPIKKMVYNLLSDKQLKAELKKYGLSIQGDRRTLISRHQRFVVLHNAECDSDRPKPLSEILKVLEREEKAMTSASAVSTFSQMFKKVNNPEEIEHVHKEYRIQNKSDFQKLIAQVKNREKKKPQPKEDYVTLSDSEDDPAPLPESSHATTSRMTDSDTDSDIAPKAPNYRKKDSKDTKRKCIESESEEEDGYDLKKKKIEDKKAVEPTSPVLSRKTPARQLRSRTAQNRTGQKQTGTPKICTRNSKRGKQTPKQILKRRSIRDESSSESSEEDCSVMNGKMKQLEEKTRSPTPDMFEPSPASSEIPCGQRIRNEREKDALETLCEMIENGDSGSTTEFED